LNQFALGIFKTDDVLIIISVREHFNKFVEQLRSEFLVVDNCPFHENNYKGGLYEFKNRENLDSIESRNKDLIHDFFWLRMNIEKKAIFLQAIARGRMNKKKKKYANRSVEI
jgi:hypothetical protein